MSDGSLSQDEIDALLQGEGGMEMGAPSEEGAGDFASGASVAVGTSSGLSSQQMQVFTELLREVKESQGSNLSGMIGKTVTFAEPDIDLISNGSFLSTLPEQIVEVRIDFSEGLQGHHSYIFSPEIATAVAGLMMGQEGVELNDAALSALEEAGNSIAGTAVTVIGDKTGATVLTTPGQTQLTARNDIQLPEGEFVRVSYSVQIDGETPAMMTEIFSLPLVVSLAGLLGASEPAPVEPAGGGFDLGGAFEPKGFDQGDLSGGLETFMSPQAQPSVQSVQFPNLTPGTPSTEQGNIGLLMDVYMEMTVELGRTKKLIRDILAMGEGTIIELDKLAGEPVDILVNNKPIAKGEVVVIDENFGVRVTEIVDQRERFAELT